MTVEENNEGIDEVVGLDQSGAELDVEDNNEEDQEPDPGVVVDGDGEPIEEQGEPKYEPNFNYKAYGEEKEFPEFLRGAVHSKESEEDLRRILCKADGLETMQEKYSAAREKVQSYESQNAELEHFKKTDFGTYLEKIGVSSEEVLNQANKILNYRELSPEERTVYDDRRKAVSENYHNQRMAESLQSDNHALIQRQHDFEMRTVLEKDDVKSFASSFDKMGGSGSFKQAVSDYGSHVFRNEKRYVAPDEAISHVMKKFEGFIKPHAEQAPGGAPVALVQEVRPETIPNLGSGKAVSPTKKKFRSMEELEKHIDARLATLGG